MVICIIFLAALVIVLLIPSKKKESTHSSSDKKHYYDPERTICVRSDKSKKCLRAYDHIRNKLK